MYRFPVYHQEIFTPMGSQNINHLRIIHHNNCPERIRKRSVYLEAGQTLFRDSIHPAITKVTPAIEPVNSKNTPVKSKHTNNVLLHSLAPILVLMKILGIFPIENSGDVCLVTRNLLAYSILLFILILSYITYMKYNKLDEVTTVEGRFEEAVIDYLFELYLLPIFINVITWFEVKKQARVLNEIKAFEKIHSRITRKGFASLLGKKPLILTVAVPFLAIVTMVITHVTMAQFKQFNYLQIIPYCYINVVVYLLGAAWYIYCDLIGKTATFVADDFQRALRPSSRVADYRSLWIILSKIIRDVGDAFGYAMVFLCLYLFLIITLTTYGLLSQIQQGLGMKDIGLAITGLCAGALLFFISDKAHYASNKVKVHFQKKLLLVELTWMNDDAQQEVTMFLRATEMNPTDISLVGFFVVNRNLFKSLIATMVTYLVVLLQFQISIPGENNDVTPMNSTTM